MQPEPEVETIIDLDKTVDVYQYPENPHLCTHASITVGDLHGNAVKLLHVLLREGIVEFKKDAKAKYQVFVDLYSDASFNLKEKTPDAASFEKMMSDLDGLIANLKVVNNKVLLRLIGDVVSDRGSNDYITLKLLEFLSKNNVTYNIDYSNHDESFVRVYENDWNSQKSTLNPGQSCSMHRLLKMREVLGDSFKTDLTILINTYYKPRLKFIEYSLSDDGITIFTHAPIAFNRIQFLAEKLGVAYDGSSKEALAYTIDSINNKIHQEYVSQNKLSELTGNMNSSEKDKLSDDGAKQNPLDDIIWHRWTNELENDEYLRPDEFKGFSVSYVHGHDPFQSTKQHVYNLDTGLGKLTLKAQGEFLNKKSEYMSRICDNYFIDKLTAFKAELEGMQESNPGDNNKEFIAPALKAISDISEASEYQDILTCLNSLGEIIKQFDFGRKYSEDFKNNKVTYDRQGFIDKKPNVETLINEANLYLSTDATEYKVLQSNEQSPTNELTQLKKWHKAALVQHKKIAKFNNFQLIDAALKAITAIDKSEIGNEQKFLLRQEVIDYVKNTKSAVLELKLSENVKNTRLSQSLEIFKGVAAIVKTRKENLSENMDKKAKATVTLMDSALKAIDEIEKSAQQDSRVEKWYDKPRVAEAASRQMKLNVVNLALSPKGANFRKAVNQDIQKLKSQARTTAVVNSLKVFAGAALIAAGLGLTVASAATGIGAVAVPAVLAVTFFSGAGFIHSGLSGLFSPPPAKTSAIDGFFKQARLPENQPDDKHDEIFDLDYDSHHKSNSQSSLT